MSMAMVTATALAMVVAPATASVTALGTVPIKVQDAVRASDTAHASEPVTATATATLVMV